MTPATPQISDDYLIRWGVARTAYLQAQHSEVIRTCVTIPTVAALTNIGLFLPQIAGLVLFGAAVLVANIGIGLITKAWIRVESARHVMNHLACESSENKVLDQTYEAKMRCLRITRLIVAVGGLVLLTIANIAFTAASLKT